MSGFVSYDSQSDEEGLVPSLVEIGYERRDAEWLDGLISQPGFFLVDENADSSVAEQQRDVFTNECLRDLEQCVAVGHTGRDALMVDVVQTLMGLGKRFERKKAYTAPWLTQEFSVLSNEFRARLSKLKIDWVSGFLQAAARIRLEHRFAATLALNHPAETFNWVAVLDLKELSTEHSTHEPPFDLNASDALVHEHRRLEFWLAAFAVSGRPHGLEGAKQLLAAGDDLRKSFLVAGMLSSCFVFLLWSGHQSPAAIQLFREAAIDIILRQIEGNAPAAIAATSSESTNRFAWMNLRYRLATPEGRTFGEPYLHLETAEEKERLLDAAYEALGKVRTALRVEDEGQAQRLYNRYHFGIAVDIVDKLGNNPWRATKALLLALRELRFPAVGPDLRYWDELGKERPDETWSLIPWLVAEQFRFHRRHAGEDEKMEDVREKFARFCLERLKTDKEGNPVEPNEIWRSAYVLSLKELRSNPGGRGHHVLHRLTKSDHDEDVRREAKATYNILRKNEGLPARTSPLSALFSAFWWMRQAHVIYLGGTVDQAGASRTRAKEVRRTS